MTFRMLSAALFAALLSPVATAQVVINEFVYDHSSTDLDEYIELYNAGSSAVDISGWTIDAEGTTSSNFDVVIPAATPAIAPGGFFLIANAVAVAPALLAANLLVAGAPSGGWLQNGEADSIMLRDAQGAVVDAVTYEVIDTSTLVSLDQVEGPGIHGALANFGYSLGSLDYNAFARIADGYDTDNNGRDFRIVRATPGTTNSPGFAVSSTGYVLDGEIAVGNLMAGAVLPRWRGSCTDPELVDYAAAQIGPSPLDDDGLGQPLPGSLLAQMGCTASQNEIGGSAWLETDPATDLVFEAFVYFQTAPTAAGTEEFWHIGLQGTSAEFFNLPASVSSYFYSTTPDVTGVGLTYVVDDVGATLYLVDYSDGSTSDVIASMPAPSGWQRVRVQATGGALEARIGGTIAQRDGAVMSGSIDASGAFGGVYVGYRKAGAPTIAIGRAPSPLYVDGLIVTGSNAQLRCFGTPTANTLGDPILSARGVPYIGNPGYGFEVDGMLPSAAFVSLFGVGFPGDMGLVIPPFIGTPPGFTLWVDAFLTVPGSTDASGHGAFPLGLAVNNSLVGLSFWIQMFQPDPALGFAIPYTATKAFKMTIGTF